MTTAQTIMLMNKGREFCSKLSYCFRLAPFILHQIFLAFSVLVSKTSCSWQAFGREVKARKEIDFLFFFLLKSSLVAATAAVKQRDGGGGGKKKKNNPPRKKPKGGKKRGGGGVVEGRYDRSQRFNGF